MSRRIRRDHSGTGVVATIVGVAVFLVLLLLATQVLFDLYARSAVAAVAFDAARIVAGSDAGASAASLARAEDAARADLGVYSRGARFRWQVTANDVELTVAVHNPSLLPRVVVGSLGLDEVTRSAVVARERVR